MIPIRSDRNFTQNTAPFWLARDVGQRTLFDHIQGRASVVKYLSALEFLAVSGSKASPKCAFISALRVLNTSGSTDILEVVDNAHHFDPFSDKLSVESAGFVNIVSDTWTDQKEETTRNAKQQS